MQPLEIEKTPLRRYTIALCKGAGLVNETQTLLQNWIPDEDLHVFVDRVLQNDLLGRATAYRTKDIVRRVFARRFLSPTDLPARRLRRIIDKGLPRKMFTEILFIYAARADHLLYDFTTERFWPECRRGRSALDNKDVLTFLSEAIEDRRIEKPWSEKVSLKITRGVLGTLRDIGFLREVGKRHREIIPYYLSNEGAAFLAYDLHHSGLTDAGICEHTDWNLFGMDRERVLNHLDSLSEESGMIVQRGGSVVRITWKFKTVEELIDALAG